MILRFVLWAILAYCLYKFVFDFLLPVVRASRQMRQRVKEFQDRVQQQPPVQEEPAPKHSKAGDYIEFEEVKEK